jgi:hypothetical protein
VIATLLLTLGCNAVCVDVGDCLPSVSITKCCFTCLHITWLFPLAAVDVEAAADAFNILHDDLLYCDDRNCAFV